MCDRTVTFDLDIWLAGLLVRAPCHHLGHLRIHIHVSQEKHEQNVAKWSVRPSVTAVVSDEVETSNQLPLR